MKRVLFFALVAIVMTASAQHRQTPIKGWSSWNTYRVNISDTLIKKQAEAQVRLGDNVFLYIYVQFNS